MSPVLEDEQSENKFSFINSDKLIDLLKLTLKVVIIINGGAAIAILTLIGSVLSSGHTFDEIHKLSAAVGCFGFGMLIGVIAVATGYRAIIFGVRYEYYVNRALTKEKISKKSRDKYMSQAEKWMGTFTKFFVHADWLLATSFAFFGLGIVCCLMAFLS